MPAEGTELTEEQRRNGGNGDETESPIWKIQLLCRFVPANSVSPLYLR
jgi:hypothetical protein